MGKINFHTLNQKDLMYFTFNTMSRIQYILKIIIQNTENIFYANYARRISKTHIFFTITILLLKI